MVEFFDLISRGVNFNNKLLTFFGPVSRIARNKNCWVFMVPELKVWELDEKMLIFFVLISRVVRHW